MIPVLFLGLYAWLFLSTLVPVQDPDLWWHLASGRFILQHLTVPISDPFSWTAHGTRWIDSYWLYDLFLYLIQAAAGVRGLILLYAAFVAAIFFLVDRRMRDHGVHWFLRAAVLVLIYRAGGPAGGYWGPQASLIPLFMAALLIGQMERWQAGLPARRLAGTWDARWTGPVFFMLWANLHRGFVVGLLLAGAYALDNRQRPEQLKRRALWWTLCAAATLVNPYGLSLFRMIWDDATLSSQAVTGWSPLNFAQNPWPLITATVFWIWMAARMVKERKPTLSKLAVAGFLTWQSLRYSVYVPYLMVWMLPDLARAVWIATKGKMKPAVDQALQAVSLVLLLAALSHARPVLGIRSETTPVPAFRLIREENLQGPFYNDYSFGGYWLWAFEGRLPVFIDGRYPAVEGYKALAQEVLAAREGPTAWKNFLARRGIETALMRYDDDAPFPSLYELYFPRARWALVYWDDAGALFLKRSSQNAAAIRRHEFHGIWPDARPGYFVQTLRRLTASQKRALKDDLERNAQLHPGSRRAQGYLRVFQQIEASLSHADVKR